jgi:hypothetical protein
MGRPPSNFFKILSAILKRIILYGVLSTVLLYLFVDFEVLKFTGPVPQLAKNVIEFIKLNYFFNGDTGTGRILKRAVTLKQYCSTFPPAELSCKQPCKLECPRCNSSPFVLCPAVLRHCKCTSNSQKLVDIDVDKTEVSGNSYLHWAVLWKDQALIKRLIKEGLNINQTNNHKFSPLSLAAQRSYEITKLLIESGADANIPLRTYLSFYELRPKIEESVRIFKLILRSGADIKRLMRDQSDVLNHLVCEKEVFSLMKEYGYDFRNDLLIQNPNGSYSKLIQNCWSQKKYDAILFLADHGFNIECENFKRLLPPSSGSPQSDGNRIRELCLSP